MNVIFLRADAGFSDEEFECPTDQCSSSDGNLDMLAMLLDERYASIA